MIWCRGCGAVRVPAGHICSGCAADRRDGRWRGGTRYAGGIIPPAPRRVETRTVPALPRARPTAGTGTVYRCDCGKTSPTGAGLAAHRRLAHPEPGSNICDYCGRDFPTPNALGGHLRAHRPR